MYGNKKVSCVVPCYNEEAGLDITFQNKPAFIDEVIVVDNGSTDKTSDIAHKYAAVIIHEKKKGYGCAYQVGLPAATGDIIVILDGDGSYPLFEIKRMFLYMEANKLDFLVGCRYPLANKAAQPAINQAANYAISGLIRILFGLNLTDSQSGMMIFKKNILKGIMPKNTGMGFSQEIKIRAFLGFGIKCGEIHISYLPRVGTNKFRRMKDSLQNLYSILSLWMEFMLVQKRSDPR